jgi:hypothetical protein
MMLSDSQGHFAIPVFTDLDAFSRYLREEGSSEFPYLSVQGTDLFSFILQHDVDAVVINLTNGEGVVITRREIALQAEGAIASDGMGAGYGSLTFGEGTNARIGPPSQPPQQLIESLRKSIARQPLITAAYLAEGAWGQGEAHYIVGVGLSHTPGDDVIAVIMEELSKGVHPALTSKECLDFVVLGNDEVSASIQQSGLLVFERKP